MKKVLKQLSYYKDSKSLEDGVSVIIPTLNNSDVLEECLISHRRAQFDEIIVVDGESSDDSYNIAKRYADKVIRTKPGLVGQAKAAMEHCTFKLIVLSEADLLMPNDFSKDAKNLFLELDCSAAVVTHLDCKYRRTYLERSFSNFLKMIKVKPGSCTTYLSGPSIIYSEIYKKILENTGSDGGSMDTGISNVLINNGHVIKAMNISATQNEEMTFKVLFEKFYWYGLGDDQFFMSSAPDWSFKRKIKSLLHPFMAYIVVPQRSLKISEYVYSLPFFVLIMIFRYIGWVTSMLLRKKEAIAFKKSRDLT